ncbi:15338_t:CDS:1, partial [Acaulospora colombiana]
MESNCEREDLWMDFREDTSYRLVEEAEDEEGVMGKTEEDVDVEFVVESKFESV